MEHIQVVLTEEELNRALKTYQKRLRLDDWTIQVHLVPQRLIQEISSAEIKYNLMRKDAVIAISTPETYIGSVEEPQNMLRDLYHELIHLLFPTIHPQGTDLELYEHGIDTLAYALFASQPLTDVGDIDSLDDNYTT